MRSSFFRLAALVLAGLLSGPASAATIQEFAVPGSMSWQDAQQGSLNPESHLETIDFARDDLGGIMPVEPSLTLAVPRRPSSLTTTVGMDTVLKLGQADAILRAARGLADAKRPGGAVWSASDVDTLEAYLHRIAAFSWNVAQGDVVALQAVELEDGPSIDAGDVLIPRLGNLPGEPLVVERLRLAGVEQVRVLINVADRFAEPGPEQIAKLAAKYNKHVSLILFGIFETAMRRANRMVKLPELVLDGDPMTTFERIDVPGFDVVQKFIFYLDLGRFFPVGLTRIHPLARDGVRLNAYALRIGVAGTEVHIAGANVYRPAILGHPKFQDVVDGMPSFVIVESTPSNPSDTIAVEFDPPRKLQWLRLDIQTDLGYDLAEWQVFADGFFPEASFESVPLPLPPATLGRVYWEEEWIGDPNKSRALVRFRTGTTPEPDVVYRYDEFNEDVPWRVGAVSVLDRRIEASTYGQIVDLNDPKYRLHMREIYTALTAQERFDARLTRAEYAELLTAERAQIEPDLVFWSGYQTATAGELLPAPSGNEYLQFRVELVSDDARAARIVRNLRFEYASPQSAGRVLAEIGPAVGVAAGADTSFVLALQTPLRSGDAGFNRIKVGTPTRIGGVTGLSVDYGDGQVQVLQRLDGGAPREPGPGQFKEVAIEDRFFVVGLEPLYPAPEGNTAPVVTLQFEGRVIDFRTTFQASIFLDTLGTRDRTEYTRSGVLVLDDTDGGVDTLATILPQPATAPAQGESVTDLLEMAGVEDRNSLSVVADIRGRSGLLDNIALAPNPFSPNGDDINDELTISYDLLRLIGPGAVSVEIFDLTGRRVRSLGRRELTAGGYLDMWDGADDGGELVPPGIYMARIGVDADAGESSAMRLVTVAY